MIQKRELWQITHEGLEDLGSYDLKNRVILEM